MMRKEPPINGKEQDWVSGWRRLLRWHAGVGKAVKRAMNKRARRRAKRECDERLEHADRD